MSRPLKDELDRLIADSPAAQVGVAAHRLATGDEVLIEADASFLAASTMKACVMMEIFHQACEGGLSLEESLQVINVFPSLADGSLYSLDPADDSEKSLYISVGASFPIRELVLRMITVSSNLATNLLVARVSAKRTTDFMRALGASDLRIVRGVEDKSAYRLGLNNTATAQGFMQVLTKLAKREVVSPEGSDEMIAILARQQLNEMIPAQLPSGTRVAHKTGWMADQFHDVGIVFPEGSSPFSLAILTRGYAETDAERAHAFVASLARTIYDAWC
jgi:beta-lactamase class A